MPNVLSASSTPSQRLRSQRPSTSAAWAWGTLRAWASSSAIVCSAADTMLLCGALTTITPRVVAASTSTLSSPMPARPTTSRSPPAASTSSVTVVAERMIRAWAPATASRSSAGESPVRTSTTWPAARRRSRPPSAISSVTRMRAMATFLSATADSGANGLMENQAARGRTTTVRSVPDRQLDALERWFVERGLPHFVERRDPAADIWARALPLLVPAYLLLGLNALEVDGARPLVARPEPRRGRVRRRRADRDLGHRQPAPPAPTAGPPGPHRRGRAGRRSSSPRRSRRSRSGSGPTGCRRWSRPSRVLALVWARHQLRRVAAAALGRRSARSPSWRCCSTWWSGRCRCSCCSRRSCSSTPRSGRWRAR